MHRPPELLKSYCNRFAQNATKQDGRNLLNHLRSIGLTAGGSNKPAQPSNGATRLYANSANADRVGIWERKKDGQQSYFVRAADAVAEWRLWAKVGRIGPKLSKRRIVLIG